MIGRRALLGHPWKSAYNFRRLRHPSPLVSESTFCHYRYLLNRIECFSTLRINRCPSKVPSAVPVRTIHSGRKPSSPTTHNTPKKVYLPGFIKANALASALNTTLQVVLKFARTNKFKFKKHSELIFDWNHTSAFARKLGFEPEYYEIDVSRADYWAEDCDPINPARPAVVAVLGHVDHGKTTLLDTLSNSDTAKHEPGRITQTLSAFLVNLKTGLPARAPSEEEKHSPYTHLLSSLWAKQKSADPNASLISSSDTVTFLDTPGHAAFFKMREGGASVADFVMLIIAADEGMREQTAESIRLLQQMHTPMLVVVNKIDIATPQQIDRIYKQLHKLRLMAPTLTPKSNPLRRSPPQYNKLFKYASEDYPVMAICEISALNGTNIEILKTTIHEISIGKAYSLRPQLLQQHAVADGPGFNWLRERLKDAEKKKEVVPKASKKGEAPSVPKPTCEATIVESRVSAEKGKTLLLIIHRGILAVGEYFVADRFLGRIRSIEIPDVRYLASSTASPINASRSKDVKYALPGMPVIVTVSLETKFNVAGSDFSIPPTSIGLFQFRKEDAEAVHAYRNLVMEYKTKEFNGTLFASVEEKERAADEEENELQETDILAEAGVSASLRVDSSSNPQVSPLSSPVAAKLLNQSTREVPPERSLPVIIRADNMGRLDALLNAAKVIALQHGVHLKVLRSGVGDINPTDLTVAQIEFEENKESKLLFFCLNTDMGPPAKQWLEKNKHRPFISTFVVKSRNVFLDLLEELKTELKERFPQILQAETKPKRRKHGKLSPSIKISK